MTLPLATKRVLMDGQFSSQAETPIKLHGVMLRENQAKALDI